MLVAVEVLFPVAGSDVVESTVAVLLSTVPSANEEAAVTCRVTVARPPAATVPTAHTTGVPEQVAPVAPVSVTPVGKGSVMVTSCASDGPALLTVIG